MKKAKTIMIQGTGSGVGKSITVAALCRIFLQDGFKVAPFKAQNMALNSYVTLDGGEMGRAQVAQAQAAGIEPSLDMNPVLLKPSGDAMAQVILNGRPVGKMSALKYKGFKKTIWQKVAGSLERLRSEYDIVVIEGAGSPAEINLTAHDIVNMSIAKLAKSPVFLVGDIDKGGVFAWLFGTVRLLKEKERSLVKGLIINKFRGDKRLLSSGLTAIERLTAKKVVGVIPYFKDILISEEDSINPENLPSASISPVKIDVLRLPHISNFTDFDALALENDVDLRYAEKKNDIRAGVDMIIIPGTKNTLGDMRYILASGLKEKIHECYQRGVVIFGVCGGFQILGERIVDSDGIESDFKAVKGVGLLRVDTYFKSEKVLRRVKGTLIGKGITVSGYEIHHGRTVYLNGAKPLFKISDISETKGASVDGAAAKGGNAYGTYLHGVFDNSSFRNFLLNKIRAKKKLSLKTVSQDINFDAEFDKLAGHFRKNLDMKYLHKVLRQGD